MQGNKVDGLYFLQGSTVTGSVDISSDTTQCHMWLGFSKQVELQVEDSQRLQDGTQAQPILDSHGFDSDDDPQEEQETSIVTGRQRRQIRRPQRYGFADLVACALTVAEDTVVQEYSTFSEAVTSSESAFWVVAMNEEIESLCKNQTWDLVKLPEDEKTVSLRRLMYGLKQSLGQRYKRFVYCGQFSCGSFVCVLLYVDDMLIAVKSMFEVKRLKSLLGDEFEMKNLGGAKKILLFVSTSDDAHFRLSATLAPQCVLIFKFKRCLNLIGMCSL